MSNYVFMKVLESSAQRYDRGLQILTRGRITAIYHEIARRIASPGAVILDVGCGTGEVALACAAQGARVEGIDINAGMLEQATRKSAVRGLEAQIHWHHLGAAEIEDVFPEAQFDGAVFCLSLSEMSPSEHTYVLEKTYTRLKPGGLLIIADEVLPETAFARWAHRLRRLPFMVATYLLTQTTTRALTAVDELIQRIGFEILETSRPYVGFALLSARRPGTDPHKKL